MWQVTTTTVPLTVRALGMIKKGTNKHINKISGSSSQYEIQTIAELLVSFGEYDQYDRKIWSKRGNENHKFKECIQPQLSLPSRSLIKTRWRIVRNRK